MIMWLLGASVSFWVLKLKTAELTESTVGVRISFFSFHDAESNAPNLARGDV